LAAATRDESTERLAPGDVVGGKLEIRRLLGEGGMGAVYEAKHTGTGRIVAVKLLRAELARHADASQRFLQEALACGKVQHPNVVDIYDSGVHEGAYYLVMELLRGESLGDRLEREGILPTSLAVEIVRQGALGTAAAHSVGIVHRDLKPDNLFLSRTATGELVVKVVDFGISKLSQPDAALATTQTGTVLGTPHYMAPEQARGMRDVDGRADVYALGAVLYRALTGRVPFEGENYNSLMVAILHDTPPEPRTLRPEISESLEKVVLHAMEKDRAARTPSADALADALTAERALLPEIADTRPLVPSVRVRVEETPYAPPLGSTIRRKRRRAAYAIVGLLAVVAAGATAKLLADRGHGEPARTAAPETARAEPETAAAATSAPATAIETTVAPEPDRTVKRRTKRPTKSDPDRGIL
jgi:serine/threonine-protein kinase